MNMQINMDTVDSRPHSSLLRRTLLGNATFSIVFGIVFMIGSQPIDTFLGLDNPHALLILGALILLFGIGVVWTATRNPIERNATNLIIAMDVAWVVGSILLLLTDVAELTTGGNWAVALVAVAVADFAILQTIGLRQITAHSDSKQNER